MNVEEAPLAPEETLLLRDTFDFFVTALPPFTEDVDDDLLILFASTNSLRYSLVNATRRVLAENC